MSVGTWSQKDAFATDKLQNYKRTNNSTLLQSLHRPRQVVRGRNKRHMATGQGLVVNA